MQAVITVPNEQENLATFLLTKKSEGQGKVKICPLEDENFDSFIYLEWPDDTYYLNWLEWLREMQDRRLITDFNLERETLQRGKTE